MIETKIIKSQEVHMPNLLKCYDDANKLFDESYYAVGTLEIIGDVLELNHVYHLEYNNEIIGFIGWRNNGDLSILNALYLRRSYQGQNLAKQLLNFYFRELKDTNVKFIVLSYLKVARWAEKFYIKNEFVTLDKIQDSTHKSLREYYDEHNRDYSQIMIKLIK